MKLPSGAIGVLLKATIKEDGVAVDLSTALVMKFKFRSPAGVVLEKAAGFFTNGSDGILTYTTEGDILAAGPKDAVWDVQAYVETSGGYKSHTFMDSIVVTPNAS